MGRNAFSAAPRVAAVFLALVVAAGCSSVPQEKKKLSPAEQAKMERMRSALQFGVTIGGRRASLCSERCARIEAAVPKDAKVDFDLSGNEVVVATIYPCDADGVAIPGGKPAAIVVYGGNKTSLDKTSDGKPLSPGYHLMDVSAGGRNSRILFEISK